MGGFGILRPSKSKESIMIERGRRINRRVIVGVAACAALFAGALPGTTQASPIQATAPPLGTAASFAVLGGSTVTNTGMTVVTGNLGVSPGTAVTGFPPGIVVPPGTIHTGDAVAATAQSDNAIAYNNLAGQACNHNLTGQDLGGKTLTSAVYCFSSSAQLTGTLTFNAEGNAKAVFIIQIGSTLTTASTSAVQVINGGSVCNVFWQVGSSATLGTSTVFGGNILALTSITLNTSTSVFGRVLAQHGAVTLDTNLVNNVCGGPTVSRVSRAAVHRTSRMVTVHWTMATQVGVIGFNVYAGTHRLNSNLIRVHQSRSYRFQASRIGRGHVFIHILLSNGHQEVVRA